MYSKVLRPFRDRLEGLYLNQRGYGSGRAFTQAIVASVDGGDILLDAGCGEARLRALLPNGVRYVGLDRYHGLQDNEYSTWTMRPTVVGTVQDLPIATEVCKSITLLHVLEHVSNPTKTLQEAFRVLKFGGKAFIDVPFLHELHHEPHDYFRYTPHALRRLAEDAGFEIEEVKCSGGYFRALAHMLEAAPATMTHRSVGGRVARVFVGYPLRLVGRILRHAQYLLDLTVETQIFTSGYHCILRKPSNGQR